MSGQRFTTRALRNRQGLTASVVTGESHVGDVDLMLGHQRSQFADNAGTVAIVHQQYHTLRLDLHGCSVQAHNARLMALADDRATG